MSKLIDPIYKPFNIESATSISKHNTFNYFIAAPTNLGKSCHQGCAFCFFLLHRSQNHISVDEMSPSLEKIWVHLAQLSILSLWPEQQKKNKYRHTNEKILPIYIYINLFGYMYEIYIYMDVFPQFNICIEVDWNRLRDAISSTNFLDIIDFLRTIC